MVLFAPPLIASSASMGSSVCSASLPSGFVKPSVCDQKVCERRHPRFAREHDVANRLVAEVVDTLVSVDCANSLKQVQCLPTKANSWVTLIQQTLNRINAFVCCVKFGCGFVSRSRLGEFSINHLLVVMDIHVTILVRLRLGRIQKSGMST